MGLFGLATYAAEQKTKVIGIKKALGASVLRIAGNLAKEFTKWVLLSNIIAFPIAFIGMRIWLTNFEYKINIELWTFLSAGVFAYIIALCAVIFQVYSAAIENPVKALQYE